MAESSGGSPLEPRAVTFCLIVSGLCAGAPTAVGVNPPWPPSPRGKDYLCPARGMALMAVVSRTEQPRLLEGTRQ